MATFSYLAKDSAGKTRKGVVEAGSETRAADVLRALSLSRLRGGVWILVLGWGSCGG